MATALTLKLGYIIPQAQGRPRLRADGNGVYSPKSDFYYAVFRAASMRRPARPMDGPLAVKMSFIFPRPKSIPMNQIFKWTKADIDNLQAGVFNALTKARWWIDDGRVCHVVASKFYAPPGDSPGIHLTVEQAIDPAWQQ